LEDHATNEPGSPSATTTPAIASSRWIVGLLGAAYCLTLSSYLTEPLSSPEIYRSLALSRYYNAHGVVPEQDIFTLLGKGNLLIAPTASFLTVLSCLEDLFGWPGLILLTEAIALTFVLGTYLLLRRTCASTSVVSLLTALTACGALFSSTLNSSLLGLATIPWTLLALSTIVARRWPTISATCIIVLSTAAQLTLLPFGAIWLVTTLLCFIAVEANELSPKYSATIRAIALLSILGFACLNLPGSSQGLLSQMVSTIFISDPQPATIYDYSSGFLFILAALGAVLPQPNRLSSKSISLLLLALCSVVVASATKLATPIASLVLTIAVANLANSSSPNTALLVGLENLRRAVAKLHPGGVIWVLSCLSAVNLVNATRSPLLDSHLPRQDVDYILEHQLPGPIWHPADVGGYLWWRFADAEGNFTKYQPLIDQEALLLQPLTSLSDRAGRFLESFQITQPQTALVKQLSPAYDSLILNPEWQLLKTEKEPGEVSSVMPKDGTKFRTRFTWALFTRNKHR
jgi:hypothetical protein